MTSLFIDDNYEIHDESNNINIKANFLPNLNPHGPFDAIHNNIALCHGNYNFGKKQGNWTYHDDRGLILFGKYNENGNKHGKWIKLTDEMMFDKCYTYDNGTKTKVIYYETDEASGSRYINEIFNFLINGRYTVDKYNVDGKRLLKTYYHGKTVQYHFENNPDIIYRTERHRNYITHFTLRYGKIRSLYKERIITLDSNTHIHTGIKHRRQIIYHSNGMPRKIVKWDMGMIIATEWRRRDGRVARHVHSVHNKTIIINWYRNGIRMSEKIDRNDQDFDSYIEYHTNGLLKTSMKKFGNIMEIVRWDVRGRKELQFCIDNKSKIQGIYETWNYKKMIHLRYLYRNGMFLGFEKKCI
jgi:hypothetical protein